MAIVFDAVSHPGGLGSNPIVWNHTCATGAQLFVVTSKDPTAVTYNGVSLTKIIDYVPQPLVGPPPVSNSCPPMKVWYLALPTSGTHSVSVTTSSPSDCGAISYTGLYYSQPDAHTQDDTTKQQNSDSQIGSVIGTVVSVQDNDWILGMGMGGNNTPQTWTNHSGSTLRYGGAGSILVDSVFVVDSNGPISPAGSSSVGADWNSGTGFNTIITLALSPELGFVPQALIL